MPQSFLGENGNYLKRLFLSQIKKIIDKIVACYGVKTMNIKQIPRVLLWHTGDYYNYNVARSCAGPWLSRAHRAPIVDAHQGDDGLLDGVVALTGEGRAAGAGHDAPVVDGLYAVHGPISDAVNEGQSGVIVRVMIDVTAGFLVDDGHQACEHGSRLLTGNHIVRPDADAGTGGSTVVAA